ncbi:S8 family serine peptidase [Streptomyces sp. NPDC093546]|uniref:cyanobactin maturation protease PatG family protein n=1 Tax=Streptomyces sp. NPDC093546 TaxID=3366040 RepID=UPI00382DEFD0
MHVRSVLAGLPFEDEPLGDPEVCVAVLDGPVDLRHPCFSGADLARLTTLVPDSASPGLMSLHGTHVTSLLFGQPGSPVTGMVPRCRGLILPVFRDAADGRAPQLDLARAIEQAVQQGAHVINISGGQRSSDGQPESMLERALRLCDDNGVLVVAAVGNDGCDCLQAPAATPTVLAVGASGADGAPLEMNNWGTAYRKNGVIAPGEDISGAAPGGGTRELTGSSFATPVVAGVAALLVAAQLRQGRRPDPKEAGRAILTTAQAPACLPKEAAHCRRHLVGRLDAPRAFALITGNSADGSSAAPDGEPQTVAAHAHEPAMAAEVLHARDEKNHGPEGYAMETNHLNAGSPQEADLVCPGASPTANTPPGSALGDEGAPSSVVPACGCACAGGEVRSGQNATVGSAADSGAAATSAVTPCCGGGAPGACRQASSQEPPVRVTSSGGEETGAAAGPLPGRESASVPGLSPSGMRAAAGQGTAPTSHPLVFAIGRINFDFGTEARRDSFRQQMGFTIAPEPDPQGRPVYREANPYDPLQMRNYLSANPWASDKLIWTLEIDRTPIYALEAEPAYGMDWGGPIEAPPPATSPSTRQSSELADAYYPPVSRVYKVFRDAIWGQVAEQPLKEPDEPDQPQGFLAAQRQGGGDTGTQMRDYISRVSIPGLLTGETVRLFSGQTVPKVRVDARGVHCWNETALVDAVCKAIKQHEKDNEANSFDDREVEMTIRAFLDKVYYQFRNLGQTSADRALNYAGTNAYNVGKEIAEGLLSAGYVPGSPAAKRHLYTLDTITVRKSAFERQGSDCQDVLVSFIDPENDRRARVTYLFPVDVNETIPITLGPVHRFLGDF